MDMSSYRPMGACIAYLVTSVVGVCVGAEPAQHVYWLTWGGDLSASPVLEPIQLGPGSAHSSIAWGHVTGKSGHARTCRGETDDVISSAGAAAARYWGQRFRHVGLGADTHGHIRGVYKNPCVAAVEEDRWKWQIVNECRG